MKALLLMMLSLLPVTAWAHQDRILPISADGTLNDLPAEYGPIRIHIERSASDTREIRKIILSSPKFRTALNQCLIDLLGDIAHVEADGSWYHHTDNLPPYVSLTFYAHPYEPKGTRNQSYSVTYSLVDGRILMGGRTWHTLIGSPRGRVIQPADKCSHWR